MEMDIKGLAIQIVKQSFKDKKDKGGNDYIEHLFRVAEPFEKDEDSYVVALLHDLIEDCPEWNKESLSCVFNWWIVNIIQLLTKDEKEDYFVYIDKIKEHDLARRIKIQDLKDNMDVSRLNDLTDKDIERLKKYQKAYKILKNS